MTGFTIEFWYWWIGAVALILLEMFAPGAYLMWLGIAAGLTGAVVYAFPDMGWEYQLALFAVLGLLSMLAGYAFFRKHPIESSRPLVDERTRQYVGQVGRLVAPIEDGRGRVRLGGINWQCAGPDLPVDTQVRVVEADGNLLTVEPVSHDRAAANRGD